MTQVIERIGLLLDALNRTESELTLAQFVDETGLNKSSAHRLLGSLEEIGLVERRASTWRPGPLTVTLGTIRLGRLDLRNEAMPWLHELRGDFSCAVSFSIPDGSHMIYVERMDSPDAFGVSARLGSRAPMWSGGSGKAVLSLLDDTEMNERLDHDEWRRLPRELREKVTEDVRQAGIRGYCVDHGEFFSGVGGIAVAIRDRQGRPQAAMSVIVTSDQLTEGFIEASSQRLLTARAALEETMAPGAGHTDFRTDAIREETLSRV